MSPPNSELIEAIREELRTEVARRLDLAPDEVDVGEGLLDSGLTSITVIRLIGRLKERFGVDLREQVFGENLSVADLAAVLADAGVEPVEPGSNR